MTRFNIQGKTALVTGANRGIGKAFVNALVDAGAEKVYAAARDEDGLNVIRQHDSGIVEPILLDVTNCKHITNLAIRIDTLDLLINNAGIVNGLLVSADNAPEIARIEMETNYFGPLNITRALLPALKQSSHAAIINICSIAAISNFSSVGPYSTSKAALHSYTQGLRADLASTSIHVMGVYPGPTNTRMTAGGQMSKAEPKEIALKTLEALELGKIDVFPDDFSSKMYEVFLQHPHELEKLFSSMQL